jgi:hypothetical protein
MMFDGRCQFHYLAAVALNTALLNRALTLATSCFEVPSTAQTARESGFKKFELLGRILRPDVAH